MKATYSLLLKILVVAFFLLNCAGPKVIDEKYGSYVKAGLIPSNEVLKKGSQFADAMKVFDEMIVEKNYFGHLSENEYREMILEVVYALRWYEAVAESGVMNIPGYAYYIDYQKDRRSYEDFDLQFKSEKVTYSRPNNTSVISVETNPKSILMEEFNSDIIYLVFRENEFYVFTQPDDVNSFVGNNFDTSKLVSGRYQTLSY